MVPYSTHDDAALAALIRTGDEQAFMEVYNRHHKILYTYCLTFVKSRAAAEDLVHDIFLLLWEKKATVQVTKGFKQYLLGICHHKAVDTVKKMVREEHLMEELLHWYEEAAPEPSVIMDEDFTRAYALARKALHRLSPQKRKVFELCKMEGKTYKEAAEILGLSPHTVKEYMSSAIASFKNFSAENSAVVIVLLLLAKMP